MDTPLRWRTFPSFCKEDSPAIKEARFFPLNFTPFFRKDKNTLKPEWSPFKVNPFILRGQETVGIFAIPTTLNSKLHFLNDENWYS